MLTDRDYLKSILNRLVHCCQFDQQQAFAICLKRCPKEKKNTCDYFKKMEEENPVFGRTNGDLKNARTIEEMLDVLIAKSGVS